MSRFLGALAVAGALLVVSVPGAAAAGTYTFHACPGTAAGFVANTGGNAVATDSCATTGALSVGLTGAAPWKAGDGALLKFTAPANTSIAGFDLTRHSSGISGSQQSGYRIEDNAEVVDRCEPGNACQADVNGPVTKTGTNLQWLQFSAGCSGFFPQTCDGAPVQLDVTKAWLTLADSSVPTIGAVTGGLTTGQLVNGTASLEFDAADLGGGLYRLFVSVDNNVIETRSLDTGTGTCSDVDTTNSDPYEFAAAVPCPLALAHVPVTIDTTKLGDGQHAFNVAVEDAAGNRTTVFAPTAGIGVRNAKANGTGADVKAKLSMYFAANKKRTHVGRKGERTVTRGRLVDSKGKGIQGAEIDVYHLVKGKPVLLKTGLKSRAAGRVTLILPNNVYGDPKTGKRQLIFSYTAFRPAPKPTSTQTLVLTIHDKQGKPVGPPTKKSKA